ncbi:penicillin-binding transpeptidase domain-containing protein [uncultured Tyzzerella sp.]|uniref:penicillin-binding transpeptidase domain-containing protein n=1 Tax=uncultured Tyzzerella sp. TaxID=2321398 RepID=UPI002941D4B7|nr:penicillin-binding transpeptidase domain-containing protein [uncultured Tyzzerella sp.]
MSKNRTNRARNSSNRKRNNKKQSLMRGRIIFLIFVITGALSFVGIYRVISIKAQSGNEFEKEAIENQINKVSDKIINPNRGSILDRNNQPLAISTTVFNVALDIRLLSELKPEKASGILIKTAEILQMNVNDLNAYLIKDDKGKLKPENDTHWKIIKKKIPYDLGKKLEEEKLIGVNLETDTQRNYPQKNSASQTIGFIMGDTRWGLEKVYDKQLTGTPGRIYRTYDGNSSVVTNDIQPIKGNDIVTTIDLTLQQYAEEIVENTYKSLSPTNTPESVSIILMNPKTGEILSMAQYPDFDLNNPNNISLLEDPVYKANFDKMSPEEQLKIRNSIWKNFAISDAFEPGSTFKAITVAAGLEEGAISKNETFYCSGGKQVADYFIRCHKRSGHGTLTVTEALEKSCNMAMLEIADRLGRNSFYKYQRDFGFGYRTGIDLYGEIKSDTYIVPVEKLNVTELATSAFGQTFTTSAIQIINAFAATINGGNIMKPYLVSQIIDENGNIVEEQTPKVVRKVISEDTSDFLKTAMIQTLEQGGTGYKANIAGYNIGGKTATAQQGKRSDNIYTLGFAAYMPAEDPEYLMLATISKPKDYAKSAPGVISPVPMVKEYFQKIIDYKAIPPSNEKMVSEDKEVSKDKILLKDYTNKDLKTVIKELNSVGIDFQIVGGSGDMVVKQIPIANTSIDKNGKVLLYIESKDDKKELVSVPDTKNLSIDEASKLIKELGFEISIVEHQATEKEIKIENEIKTENESTEKTSENSNQNTDLDIIEKTSESNKQDNTTKKVFEQMPEAGVFIEKGSIIKIKVK